MLGGDLMVEIDTQSRRLEELLKTLARDGRAFAEARESYQIAKAEKELELRSDGHPVTLVQDLALGDRQVARLRREKDIAETLYSATREALYVAKLKLRIVENQYDREWSQARR